MHKSSLTFVALLSGLATGGFGAAHAVLAHDVPELRIESPADGAIVPISPGAGGMVIVEFDVDGFDIEPLEDPQHIEIAEDTTDVREGHIRVSVDHAVHWMHASDDPVVIGGLFPGLHTVTLELVSENHQPLTPPVKRTVTISAGATGP